MEDQYSIPKTLSNVAKGSLTGLLYGTVAGIMGAFAAPTILREATNNIPETLETISNKRTIQEHDRGKTSYRSATVYDNCSLAATTAMGTLLIPSVIGIAGYKTIEGVINMVNGETSPGILIPSLIVGNILSAGYEIGRKVHKSN